MYAPLLHDSNTVESQAEKDLKSILNTDTSAQTIQHPNQDVYNFVIASIEKYNATKKEEFTRW